MTRGHLTRPPTEAALLFLLPANGRQCLLAQYIGIAFARLCKLNDLDGDGLISVDEAKKADAELRKPISSAGAKK